MSGFTSSWDAVTSPYAAYWWASGVLAACVILGFLMWAALHGSSLMTAARFWWHRRPPLSDRAADRVRERARAEEPDPGPELPDDDWVRWQVLVARFRWASDAAEVSNDETEMEGNPW